MNSAELINAIQSYTENQFPEVFLADGTTEDSVTQIKRFIQQAEQRIYNTVQFPLLRKNVTGSTTAGNPYLACPDDFLAPYSIAVIGSDGYIFLLNKDVNFIRQAYPRPSDLGVPKYYAMFGAAVTNNIISKEMAFILGPTPSAVFAVELHYYYYPESITSAGTSWLGDNLDSVLFYGSLVEAYTFMKGEPDMIAVYEGKYKEALAMAKRLGDGLERGDTYRNGQYREPPLPQTTGVR